MGKQVKVIKPASVNYRPPAGPTPPPASNTAPNAGGVTQTPKLGKTGPTGGGGGSAQLAPKPRRAPTTGPKGSQSVNYDHRQTSRPTAPTHLGASGRDYADQQQQPVADKGN